MYEVEHQELFAAIRSGDPINDGEYMADSTMWAILGRMADYTGRVLTWEQGLVFASGLHMACSWMLARATPIGGGRAM